MIRKKIAKYLAGRKYIIEILENPTDLSEFKERPTTRLITGLILMGFSYVIGWPAVAALSVLAVWCREPLLAVIGCRCCMAACPYGARHFNWSAPGLPAEELNPDMHVLGNRPRPRGVVEKCTFCIQRTRAGRYPACVEICPVGARKFGNLLDPESEISRILREKRVFVLKAELKTEPKFFYFFGV